MIWKYGQYLSYSFFFEKPTSNMISWHRVMKWKNKWSDKRINTHMMQKKIFALRQNFPLELIIKMWVVSKWSDVKINLLYKRTDVFLLKHIYLYSYIFVYKNICLHIFLYIYVCFHTYFIFYIWIYMKFGEGNPKWKIACHFGFSTQLFIKNYIKISKLEYNHVTIKTWDKQRYEFIIFYPMNWLLCISCY